MKKIDKLETKVNCVAIDIGMFNKKKYIVATADEQLKLINKINELIEAINKQ